MRKCSTCHVRSLLLLVLIALPRFEGNVIGDVRDDVIIGGYDIDICKAPHMVALLYKNQLMCGGSIIDEHTILTAAHCLYRILRPDVLTVRYGSSFYNEGGTVQAVEALKTHEKYGGRTADYDVGLIRVKEPIVFGKNARPIALPEKAPETGTTVRVSGWGETESDAVETTTEPMLQVPKDISKHLKSTEVDIVDWKKCKAAYQEFEVLTPRMICAASPGKDSCQGDSGGGMDYNGTVVGIVSFGNKCAYPDYPGVYTNVADPEILDFIKRGLN